MNTIPNVMPGALGVPSLKKLGMHDAQLARALAKAANPMVIIDRSSTIMWCNDAYCQMVNVPFEQILMRKPLCLAPTKENGKFLTDLWLVLNGGHIWSGELTERTLDGTLVHVDAVMTPLDDAHGKPALFMLFLHDITKRKNEFNHVLKMANHDALTGLGNRSFFLSMLDHNLTTSQRNQTQTALLFIDLDGFKQVNDEFGHDVGDQVLISAAEILRTNVRRSDFVARYGGDEFVCILGEVSRADDAGNVAAKIIKALSLMQKIGGHDIKIGASIGVAVYPHDSLDGEALLKAADMAMYEAKNAGKNCWRRLVTKDLGLGSPAIDLTVMVDAVEPRGRIPS